MGRSLKINKVSVIFFKICFPCFYFSVCVELSQNSVVFVVVLVVVAFSLPTPHPMLWSDCYVPG